MPSQSLVLSLDSKTLVSDLKRQLSVDFPSSPAISAQKLIFGGKICGDDESLEQILAQMQSSQLKEEGNVDEHIVFHLLVTSTGIQTSVEPKTPLQTRNSSKMVETPPDIESRPCIVSSEPNLLNIQSENSISTPSSHLRSGQMQSHHDLYRQSVLMQQQAMVLHQIQYLQMMLMQQQVASTSTDHQFSHNSQFAAASYGNFYQRMQSNTSHARPNIPQTVAHEAVAAPAPIPAQNQAFTSPPRTRSLLVEMVSEVFRLLDLRLAFKMAFMLLIVGKDTPMDRVIMLILLSFISYLHITGIFAKLYEIYNRRRSHNSVNESDVPLNVNLPGAATGAGVAITNRFETVMRVLSISADRGFRQDVKSFVVGLLLSLVPAWRPQPIFGAPPVVENAMPDGAPLQGI
ncbi:putative Ubiquitin domain-containing protein [Plasmopara halstedii]